MPDSPPFPAPRVKPAGGDAYGGRLTGGRGNEGRRRCFKGDKERSGWGRLKATKGTQRGRDEGDTGQHEEGNYLKREEGAAVGFEKDDDLHRDFQLVN